MIKIIFENKDIVAINKPAGLLTHPDRSKKGGKSVVEWLLVHYPEVKGVGDPSAGSLRLSSVRAGQAPSTSSLRLSSVRAGQAPSTLQRVQGRPEGLERATGSLRLSSVRVGQVLPERPGIVHRLDKDTSGVLIVARNQAAFEYLKKLFQTGGVQKTYVALVHGELAGRGVINKPIGLRPGTTKRSVTSKNMKMVKEAVTEYEAQEIFEYSTGGKTNYCTFLKVMPKTGRTHQIRVHLASIGHPIVGDALYGPKKQALAAPRQFLHAAAIELVLSDKSKMKIEADLPDDLQRVIDGLREIR